MQRATASTSSGAQLKSGNPCPRLMAPCSSARRDITEKMVTPAAGSFDRTVRVDDTRVSYLFSPFPGSNLDYSRTRRSPCWVLPSPFGFRFGSAVGRSPSSRFEGFRRERAIDLRTVNREPNVDTNRAPRTEKRERLIHE